jgi:hypothetical protein
MTVDYPSAMALSSSSPQYNNNNTNNGQQHKRTTYSFSVVCFSDGGRSHGVMTLRPWCGGPTGKLLPRFKRQNPNYLRLYAGVPRSRSGDLRFAEFRRKSRGRCSVRITFGEHAYEISTRLGSIFANQRPSSGNQGIGIRWWSRQ